MLRASQRYRAGALIYAQDHCVASGEATQVLATLAAPEFHYDIDEHIAYCFSCVGRSLEPELHAALVLRDVYEYTNDEAAKMLGLSKSVLRHRLAEARTQMTRRYDALCALVNKEGVCYQCEGLRQGAHITRRGPEAAGRLGDETRAREDKYRKRLRIVRDANIDSGTSQRLHDLLWEQLDRIEKQRPQNADLECIPAAQTSCSVD